MSGGPEERHESDSNSEAVRGSEAETGFEVVLDCCHSETNFVAETGSEAVSDWQINSETVKDFGVEKCLESEINYGTEKDFVAETNSVAERGFGAETDFVAGGESETE